MFIKESLNEHGVKQSHHKCDECGQPFSVVPSVKDSSPDWKKLWACCLDEGCLSYDPNRDVELSLFHGCTIHKDD